ncbi:MAG: hypothetical protein IIA33_04760 [Planctomycetes bacterium]|nr:hypothetical protein [Planctomycetota bacterium]
MPRKRDTFKLGMAVIVMAFLLVACLLFIGSGGLFVSEHGVLIVRFRPGGSMPEISEGSVVTYFGQKVGLVVKTELVEDRDAEDSTIVGQPFLEVQVSLYEDLGLREDCTVVASGPPLGGIGMLEILNRGSSAKALEPSQAIYGQVAGFQAALDMITRELDESNADGLVSLIKVQLDAEDERSLVVKVHKSLADINTLTASLARELDREQDDVFLAKIHTSVDLINRSLSEVADLVEKNRPKIDSTIASAERASGKLDTGVMDVLARELELDSDPEVTLLTKVHDALTGMNESLADLNVVTDGAKEIVVLNKDRISEVVENITTASQHLKRGIRDLELHPWRLIFEPSVGEKRELHMLNVAREFAEAAADLDDSTSRLHSLLDVHEGQMRSDDPSLAEIRTRLLETVRKFGEAEQALWAELKVE